MAELRTEKIFLCQSRKTKKKNNFEVIAGWWIRPMVASFFMTYTKPSSRCHEGQILKNTSRSVCWSDNILDQVDLLELLNFTSKVDIHLTNKIHWMNLKCQPLTKKSNDWLVSTAYFWVWEIFTIQKNMSCLVSKFENVGTKELKFAIKQFWPCNGVPQMICFPWTVWETCSMLLLLLWLQVRSCQYHCTSNQSSMSLEGFEPLSSILPLTALWLP